MKIQVLGAATVLAFSAVASAQTAQKKLEYPVYGAGTASCGQWVEGRKTTNDPMVAVMTQWMLGYMTAASYTIPDHPPVESDVGGFRVALDTYCQKNPTEEFYIAAYSVLLQMRRQ